MSEQATEEQINYINILKEKALANLTYDASGWGFTAKDLCESFEVRVLRMKSTTYQVMADAIIEKFSGHLNGLNLTDISKADASDLIDKFKNDKVGIEWLNLSEDVNERAAQINALTSQDVAEVRKNSAGNYRVYAV